MSIFCAKIFLAKFLLNIKVPEFEHELEPGDLGFLNFSNPKKPSEAEVVSQVVTVCLSYFYEGFYLSKVYGCYLVCCF